MALRGVDLIAAMTIVAELGDISRFESPRQLMAHLGTGAIRTFKRRKAQNGAG